MLLHGMPCCIVSRYVALPGDMMCDAMVHRVVLYWDASCWVVVHFAVLHCVVVTR